MASRNLRFWISLMLGFSFIPFIPCHADSNFSISGNAHYSRSLNSSLSDDAIGPNILLEWEPSEDLSLGLNLDLIDFWNHSTPGETWVNTVGVVGRISPWGLKDTLSPYLIGGAGYTLIRTTWVGSFMSMAGLGTRLFLSPQFALDGNVTYDLSTPINTPPQTLSTRLGISYFFNPVKEETSVAATKPIPQAEKPSPVTSSVEPSKVSEEKVASETGVSAESQVEPPVHEENIKHYVVEDGDNLWNIAGRKDIYSDNKLWPLIFNANRNMIKNPDVINEGTELKIPRNYSTEDAQKARLKAGQ